MILSVSWITISTQTRNIRGCLQQSVSACPWNFPICPDVVKNKQTKILPTFRKREVEGISLDVLFILSHREIFFSAIISCLHNVFHKFKAFLIEIL